MQDEHYDYINPTAIEAEARIVAICTEDIAKLDMVDAEPSDFFCVKWKSCYEKLLELRGEYDDTVDSLVLMSRLTEISDSVSYSDLINLEASPILISRYSEIVIEEAAKRRLRVGLSRAISAVSANGSRLDEVLTLVSSTIGEATVGQESAGMPIGGIVAERIGELIAMADEQASGAKCTTGVPTGIPSLDSMGFIRKEIVTLVAARPGMGKSAFALNIANNSNKLGTGIHVFQLEDGQASYADRTISLASGVSTDKISALQMSRADLASVMVSAERAAQRVGWLVDSRAGISASEIVRCVRRSAAQNNTKMVIVDYIQILKGAQGLSKKQKIAEAIDVFADAAKMDKMAYLVLSQLNRDCEKRDDKRPTETDLSDCGELEQRSKAIMMLYRPHRYGDRYPRSKDYGMLHHGTPGQPVPENIMEVLVRKNSNGKVGTVLVDWCPEKMKISELKG